MITVYTKPACVQCNATYRALTKKGIEVQPGSQANMFMVNWKKPAKDMQAASSKAAEDVAKPTKTAFEKAMKEFKVA